MTVDEQLLLRSMCEITSCYHIALTSHRDDAILTSLEVILLLRWQVKRMRFRAVFETSLEVILFPQNVLKLRAS